MTKTYQEMRMQVQESIKKLGGIEKYLQYFGVEAEAIYNSKNEYAILSDKLISCYDKEEDIENTLIPVSQIKGISRPEKEFTWFDLMNYGATCVPPGVDEQALNVDKLKFLDFLFWLEEEGIDYVQSMFEKKANIDFVCYQKENTKEYYQITNGNHRVITAKVLGITWVNASLVKVYNFNMEKYREYERLRKSEKTGLNRVWQKIKRWR